MDKLGNKPLALAKHPDCINALNDAREKVNDPPDEPLYYRNTYFKEPGFKEPGFKEPGFKEPGFKEPGFKEPGNQANSQNEHALNQSNTVDLANPVRYQEKLLTSDQAVTLISYQEKYPECNFVSIPEDNSIFVLARDFLDKITGNCEDAIFGYSGIRGNPNTRNHEDLKKIYVPVQFINSSHQTDLPLAGYPFHIEGTKNKIIEFLHKYAKKGFHFTAKSIDQNEQSGTRVIVNIKLCLDNLDLTNIVREFFAAPIKTTIGQIPLDLIGKFIEHPDFQDLLKKICDVVNTDGLKEKLQKEVVKIAKENQENLSEKESRKSKKISFESIINNIRNQLEMLSITDINEALSKNNFSFCSGPIDLLHNIKKDQKIQIEFDRFESSKSPARLQINSTGSLVDFKDLSEALKVIFKMD